ncbi:hypothetical protein ACJJTC_015455 [Scirpophaga incertulas]
MLLNGSVSSYVTGDNFLDVLDNGAELCQLAAAIHARAREALDQGLIVGVSLTYTNCKAEHSHLRIQHRFVQKKRVSLTFNVLGSSHCHCILDQKFIMDENNLFYAPFGVPWTKNSYSHNLS